MTRPRDPMSYKDIKQVVLERIQSRVWLPDSMLPNEVALADEFSSTRTTVNRALRELADEGYIERKRKAGTRVLRSPTRKAQFAIPLVKDEVAATGAAYRYALVERTEMGAPDWLAAKLGLEDGQDVLHLRCMHYADGAPFQFEDRWIVIASIPAARAADFSEIGPNQWLLETVPFTDIKLSFMASKADQTLSEFLDATPGDPIFTVERMTWLQGNPVTLARLCFAPGYKMTTRL